MLGILTDYSYYPFSLDYLTFITNLFN